ncbi:MAG: hypothetical protein WC602_02935 [archaeon]
MRKGQLLSLDLLLSLILITASTGIVLHWTEEQSTLLKEKQFQAQVLQIAELASNNLAANPSIVCELIETDTGNHLAYLNNCIPTKLKNITRQEMGIPDGFGCLIDDGGSGANLLTDCGNYSTGLAQLGAAKNYYSVKRTVVYYYRTGAALWPGQTRSQITRQELSSCMASGICNMAKGAFTLYAWNQNE